jgi:DNA-directed RNA polymerase alpha subunit
MTKNALMEAGYKFLRDVVPLTERELKELKFVGRKGIHRIKEVLEKYGLNQDKKREASSVPSEESLVELAHPFLETPLADLRFSLRTSHVLENAGLRFVRELIVRDKDQLLKLRNMGRRQVREIEEVLKENGLGLGMKLKEVLPPDQASPGNIEEPLVSTTTTSTEAIPLSLETPLYNLDFSVRTINAIETAGFRFLKDLVIFDEEKLRQMKFPLTSIQEIQRVLERNGFQLGMESKEPLTLPIEAMDLQSRIITALKAAGIRTVKDILDLKLRRHSEAFRESAVCP